MRDVEPFGRVTATYGRAEALQRRSVLLQKTARIRRLEAIRLRNDARCARRMSHGPLFAMDYEPKTRTQRVIIVDDNRPLRESMAEILTLAGYDAREVGGIDTALSMLREEEFDLVLLDLGLDLEGIELLNRAERLPPVILMSGTGDHVISDPRISRFLLKPIFPGRLIEEVALHARRTEEV